MTDKELISIVDAKAKKLWNEINTGHEYSIIDTYNQFYGICMEIAEMVQEEPVSIWHDKVQKIREKVVEMVNSINPFIPDEDGKNSDYEAGKLDVATQVLQIMDSLEEPVSEDLGDYINELSKQFPEVSFAKLSRIAVRVSRWQQNQDVKNKLPKVTDRIELDEYAYQCAYDMSNDWAIDNPTWKDVEDACKLGAKWKERQMMAKAINGKVVARFPLASEPLYVDAEIYLRYAKDLKEGEKVKVIVIKED